MKIFKGITSHKDEYIEAVMKLVNDSGDSVMVISGLSTIEKGWVVFLQKGFYQERDGLRTMLFDDCTIVPNYIGIRKVSDSLLFCEVNVFDNEREARNAIRWQTMCAVYHIDSKMWVL